MGQFLSSIEERPPTPGFPNLNWLRPVNPPPTKKVPVKRRSIKSYLIPRRRDFAPRTAANSSVFEEESAKLEKRHSLSSHLQTRSSLTPPSLSPTMEGRPSDIRRKRPGMIIELPPPLMFSPSFRPASPFDSPNPSHRRNSSQSSMCIPIVDTRDVIEELPVDVFPGRYSTLAARRPSFAVENSHTPPLSSRRSLPISNPGQVSPPRHRRQRIPSNRSHFSSSDDESNGDLHEELDDPSFRLDSPLSDRPSRSAGTPISSHRQLSPESSSSQLRKRFHSGISQLSSEYSGQGEDEDRFYTGRSSSSISSEEPDGSVKVTTEAGRDILPPCLPFRASYRTDFFASPSETPPSLGTSDPLSTMSPLSQWAFDTPPLPPPSPIQHPGWPSTFPPMTPGIELRYDPMSSTPSAEVPDDLFQVHPAISDIIPSRYTGGWVSPGLQISLTSPFFNPSGILPQSPPSDSKRAGTMDEPTWLSGRGAPSSPPISKSTHSHYLALYSSGLPSPLLPAPSSLRPTPPLLSRPSRIHTGPSPFPDQAGSTIPLLSSGPHIPTPRKIQTRPRMERRFSFCVPSSGVDDAASTDGERLLESRRVVRKQMDAEIEQTIREEMEGEGGANAVVG